MAAFSYHNVESVHNNVQIPPIKMHGLIPNPNTTGPQIYSSPEEESFQQQVPTNPSANYGGCFKVSVISSTDPNSSSSVSTDNKLQSQEQVTKRRISKEGFSVDSSPSQDIGGEKMNGKRKKRSNGVVTNKVEEKKKKTDGKKGCEEAPTGGYIHVRARRGQATDNHSLAERVRREKISERMKMLQALVPGCEKVTGKALMLDEIINYVQSLQNQVEFLSMKLSSLNPMLYDFGMDLDSFMVRPDQTLCSLNMHQMQPPMLCDILANANNQVDHGSAFQLQSQVPQHLSQAKGHVLWDIVEEQRHIFGNQLQGFTNNFSSLH